MMFHEHLQSVTFPGYYFLARKIDTGWLLWAVFYAPCAVKGGHSVLQTTRKWHLSENPTREEFVGTALKLVLASVEHEAREHFKYEGDRIFDPHHDIRSLQMIAAKH